MQLSFEGSSRCRGPKLEKLSCHWLPHGTKFQTWVLMHDFLSLLIVPTSCLVKYYNHLPIIVIVFLLLVALAQPMQRSCIGLSKLKRNITSRNFIAIQNIFEPSSNYSSKTSLKDKISHLKTGTTRQNKFIRY